MNKNPTLLQSIIPIAVLIILLTLNVFIFKDDTLSGSNQVALLLASAVAAIIAFFQGKKWNNLLNGMVKSINSAMPAIIILLLIGSLAGTWLISGIVPGLIYYGLQILNPKIFLFATVIICSLVSLATGSSWSTIATIGIALLGIGSTLGINKAIVAGAIISGAYFGDKMSPLSDTTNLAPAVAGTDLFTHIRYMLFTTVPSMSITLIIFLFMGFRKHISLNDINVEDTLSAINSSFNINALLFIVPVILIIIIIKKVPPIPALFTGTILGGIVAIIFQPDIIHQIAGADINYIKASYIAVMKAIFGEINITTTNVRINELFGTYGMAGMLNTIWLILAAMIFGGTMEAGGFLLKISSTIISYAKSTGGIIASTVATCIFFNITASDQYMAIVVPGKMYSETFKKRKLKAEVLSRSLEDSGTVTSVLVPWNTGGATQARVLGVPTLSYLPYCFFNIISPLMSVLIGYIGWKIRKRED